MAVSCLEQRLPPLTDAVPAYAPWGPFGLPPSMEEEEEEGEAAAEDEIASPVNTRRSGRRCKTWGGYIPHTMNDESPSGTMMTPEDVQSFRPSFNTEDDDDTGAHHSGFVADIDVKDIPELRVGLGAFEPGGSESIAANIPRRCHDPRTTRALHAGMAAFDADAPRSLPLDVLWRGCEMPDDMPAPNVGLATFESDGPETPRKEMPWLGHETNQEMAALRADIASLGQDGLETIRREMPWRGHETDQDIAALRASIASLGQDGPETFHRDVPWRGHETHQDMAALRAGFASRGQDGPEPFQRELTRRGNETRHDMHALQVGPAALGQDGPQHFQTELPWPRRETHRDMSGFGSGFAAFRQDGPDGFPRGVPRQGHEARQDMQALRMGFAAFGQDRPDSFQREAPRRGLEAGQDMLALRAGLAAFEPQARAHPQGEAPWSSREVRQGVPAFNAGLSALQPDGPGRPRREAPWCGRNGLQGDLCGGGQSMQAMIAPGEGGSEGYFGVDSINPGSGFGAAADPAYVCGLAPRPGPEFAAAPGRAPHSYVGPAPPYPSSAAQAPAAPAPGPWNQLGSGGRQASGWAAEQQGGKGGKGGKGGPAASWAAEDEQALRHGNPASGWAITDTKAAFVEPGVTTLMIQNLPPMVSRRHFLEEIDRKGFANLYNYCHLPMAFDTGSNKGFAFINFVEAEVAQAFHATYNGSFTFGNQSLDKALRVVKAEVQGFNANAAKALSKKTRRIRNSNFKPVLAGQPSDSSALVGA